MAITDTGITYVDVDLDVSNSPILLLLKFLMFFDMNK